jgi:hypothetical protein
MAWPFAARGQQPAIPIVGFVIGRSPEESARLRAAFRKSLNQTGNVDGQKVMVDTTGWGANTIACRHSGLTSSADVWP